MIKGWMCGIMLKGGGKEDGSLDMEAWRKKRKLEKNVQLSRKKVHVINSFLLNNHIT